VKAAAFPGSETFLDDGFRTNKAFIAFQIPVFPEAAAEDGGVYSNCSLNPGGKDDVQSHREKEI
jgi:hypothetical protein